MNTGAAVAVGVLGDGEVRGTPARVRFVFSHDSFHGGLDLSAGHVSSGLFRGRGFGLFFFHVEERPVGLLVHLQFVLGLDLGLLFLGVGL